jgi:hypothetical protein
MVPLQDPAGTVLSCRGEVVVALRVGSRVGARLVLELLLGAPFSFPLEATFAVSEATFLPPQPTKTTSAARNNASTSPR